MNSLEKVLVQKEFYGHCVHTLQIFCGYIVDLSLLLISQIKLG